MTGVPGYDRARAREAIAPDRTPAHPDLDLFARLEGLFGEEQALLRIPDSERSDDQHHRLRRIGEELDGAFEKLRRRAERLRRTAGAT